MNEKKQENVLELSPSNWLYNASIIGFLRVLEYGKKLFKFSENGGKVSISKEVLKDSFELRQKFHVKLREEKLEKEPKIFKEVLVKEFGEEYKEKFEEELKKFKENIKKELKELKKNPIEKEKREMYNKNLNGELNKLKKELGKVLKKTLGKERKERFEEEFKNFKNRLKKVEGEVIWGRSEIYPNYIQPAKKEFFIKDFVPSLEKVSSENNKNCIFCEGYYLPEKEIESLREKFINRGGKKEKFESFISQREKLQVIHEGYLASSIGEMPNSFWNLNQSAPICHLCSYFIIFHHLAFAQTPDGDIFINAPDFQLMWELNRFVRETYGKGKAKDTSKLFGLSLMEMAVYRWQNLGAWTMSNIEVIRKNGDIIDHFELSPDVVKVLMDPTVASILESLRLWPILEIVMREKYSELLVATYCAAKAYLAESVPKNHCVNKYGGNKNKAEDMFSKLPRLFAKIKEIIKEDKMCEEKSKEKEVNAIYKAGKDSKKLSDEFKKRSYKILELTRLGKINDAYREIIRILIPNEIPIPSALISILSEEDQELQKSYIYAYLSGVLGGEKQGGEQ